MAYLDLGSNEWEIGQQLLRLCFSTPTLRIHVEFPLVPEKFYSNLDLSHFERAPQRLRSLLSGSRMKELLK
jgi:hypothetical protein